ncbi:MAG: hypothetical protein ACTS8Z_00355 [Candidatus Limnocylindrales bacterium]
MTNDDHPERRPPRERFVGTEHVFDVRAIAAGLRQETTPLRDGHRQMAIFQKGTLSLIVFDFEAGGRLADHHAEAYVTIMAVSGALQVSTPTQMHEVDEGSIIVLDPGVRHDVRSPGASQMLLIVDLVEPRDAIGGEA